MLAAYQGGFDLFWPAGTYVSTSNIPYFNSVNHYGSGVVKRGTDTFKIAQVGGQRNTLYVGTTGLSTNDGLSANEPLDSIQTAFNLLTTTWKPSMLVGGWTVKLAAGTYKRSTFSAAIDNAERLIVKGDSVNWGVPTAIIDNVDSETNAIALYFNGVSRCQVEDVLAQNFNGTNGQGFVASGAKDLYTKNAHAKNCGWTGINMSPQGVLRVEGGIVDACSEGIRTYGNVVFTIGYNSSEHRTIIKNCTFAGFSAYNSSNGHVDYADLTNNAIGASIINQSRVDFMGAHLIGNHVGIACDMNSAYIKNTPEAELFNSGAANKINERCQGFSLPYEALSYFSYTPSSRISRYGAGWSGASLISSYKHVFEMQSGDSGISLAASAGQNASLSFTYPTSSDNGVVTYVPSTKTFRILTGGQNIHFIDSASIRPATDNVASVGNGSLRFTTVYAATGAINTSDLNYKEQVTDLSEQERIVAVSLKPLIKKFKFKDAVATKGTAARWHVGVIAQEVVAAFEAQGLNPFDYGIVCFDEWAATDEIEAGSRYAIRYDELIMFILSMA